MCGSRHSRCFLSAGIRQLQLILLKVALLLGVEVHVGVEFKKVLEPPEDQRTHSETMPLATPMVSGSGTTKQQTDLQILFLPRHDD